MSQYESLPLYLETNCNQEVYSNPFKFIFSMSTFLGSYPSEGMAITSREDGALMVEEASPENEIAGRRPTTRPPSPSGSLNG